MRILNVSFSGEKLIHGRTEAIDFKWEPKQGGVNIIASDDNFAGKSSILQIILWALRGEPKSLTSTVHSWIRSTQAELLAGDRRVRVKMDVQDGRPHGSVDLLTNDGAVIHSLPFVSAEMLKARMNSVMLEALALEPIASSRDMPSQNKTVLYSDGWTAYTGAFLFDSDSSALIGEHVGSDFTQRLLQVFLGIPWATTLFQARAAKRVAESQVQSRRRALGKLGDQSVADLEAKLDETKRKIADGTARDQALAILAAAKAKFSQLSSEMSGLQTATFVLNAEVSAGEEDLLQKNACS
ncbi:hypothetical protein LG197_23430 [Pseudomonas asiatica]|uniref:hypothetical protein n=1 Tax=Pseudomonas TaxID=286 RepID=UPI001FFCCF58|nr:MULTISPECIES: hypothetical protein [Pseudomonas]MCK2121160.1 hypothetical protein [Pseudomonas sp. PNPG3]WDM87533.1 hypothetical protein LG197_23430 [Pseudomonas asiatica]